MFLLIIKLAPLWHPLWTKLLIKTNKKPTQSTLTRSSLLLVCENFNIHPLYGLNYNNLKYALTLLQWHMDSEYNIIFSISS